ncbi:MAG: hypothetical protein KBD15_02495 [Candidatus Magasanikbacteria bacterium]|jgi:lysophospholipase L1-like esterase|nr:hypothetical protein [Candidatus Magasanikbacteria bacterium]
MGGISKKFFFLSLIFIGIGMVLFYGIKMQYFIHIGKKIAAKAVPYEQHPINPTHSILTIGDSSVVGTGATVPQTSVAGRLGAAYPQADIINLGVNGARLADIPPRLTAVKGQTFDLVLIHIGGNGIVRFTSFKEAEKNLTNLLMSAKQLSSTVVILHGGDIGSSTIFPPGFRYVLHKRSVRMRDIFIRVTQETETHYVDLFRSKQNDPFYLNPTRYYAPDFFHPSDAGYGYWYTEIQTVLEQINWNK